MIKIWCYLDNKINFQYNIFFIIFWNFERVSYFLDCEVKSSYIEEQGLFGKWNKLNSTVKENYICRYYIADVTTFCYNDNTFGDTSMGIYKLNILKEY